MNPGMNKPLSQMTCWAMTEGHAGMENQCVGLAEAIGVTPTRVHTQASRTMWKFLPPSLWPDPLSLKEGGGRFEAPWPDIVITCGRRSVATSMAIRKASGGKTFTIHIQDPHAPADKFDMLVVPRHDTLRAPNVYVARGALHHVTREKLDKAAAHFSPMLAHLPRPLISVLVGGSNKKQEVSPDVIRDLAEKLKKTAQLSNAGIAVTPSRRTGKANEVILREVLSGSNCWVWDGTGDNPYFGLLALADAIVVTADSVSMVSEAAFTGKPVYVYDLEGGSSRLRRFQQDLFDDGITKPFTGTAIEHWAYQPLDDTREVAAIIREKLMKRD